MEEQRKIAHVDMDAFYAAVEQLDHPAYRGQPVIVGGLGSRGVVATASYKARTYGITSAMPMSRARRLCPSGIYLAPRFHRYRELSAKLQQIFLSYTPIVEMISLDEAFLDLTDSELAFGPAGEVAQRIKRHVTETTGLTCSVGLAHNRFVAKLASELQKPNGLVLIEPGQVAEILAPLPVGMIWGVGKVTEQRLHDLGLRTIRALRAAPIELLVREFGMNGRKLFRLARGEDDTPVLPYREAKSLSRELTLVEDIHNLERIEQLLRGLARKVAAQLRAEKLQGRTVCIKVRFPDFHTITRQVSLGVMTDSPCLIEAISLDLLRQRVDLAGKGVRLLGVGVSNLSVSSPRQLSLFEDVLIHRGMTD
ncbi:MAG: DNA polymerase IV [Candidatus Bipolaricaulota bacterium]|nr:DNA polymerase IV [Candidatus Bipolaricaulota bacterium]